MGEKTTFKRFLQNNDARDDDKEATITQLTALTRSANEFKEIEDKKCDKNEPGLNHPTS